MADEIPQRLVDSLAHGTTVDLASGRDPGTADRDGAHDGDRTRDVAAEDLRRLLRDPGAHGVQDPRGFTLRGARVVGRLDLDGLEIAFPLAFHLCVFEDGITFRSARLRRLELVESVLACSPSEPVQGSDCLLSTDLVLDRTLIEGDCPSGGVHISGAEIHGELTLRGAHVTNRSGPAIRAERVDIRGGVRLTKRFRAVGRGDDGAVRFSRSTLGTQLRCGGAAIENPTGPALTMYDARVGGMYLDRDFTAAGAGDKGAVRLVGVRAEGLVTLRQSRLTNPSGPALLADRADVSGDLFLDDCRATGGGGLGAVRLFGARIGGQLTLRAAVVENRAGPGLLLIRSTVSGDLGLDGATMRGAHATPVVDLSGTEVGGGFGCVDTRVASDRSREYAWMLDGFAYRGVPTPGRQQHWAALLRDTTPVYLPQPYQQLISAYRSAGHENDARQMSISQRDDQVRRGGLTGPERAWARFTGLTLGYGWKPGRALYLLLSVLATSVLIDVVLGASAGLTQTIPGSTVTRPCAIVQRVEVGLRLGAPVFSSATKAGDACTPALDTVAGQAIVVASWVLQLMAWGAAALFVAGFTSAVRKT